MVVQLLRKFFSNSMKRPLIYEFVITKDGLSIEGNSEFGAYVEDVLKYIEKRRDAFRLKGSIRIFIKDSEKVIGIFRLSDLGIGVVGSSIEDVINGFEDIRQRAEELLKDKYKETFNEYFKEQNKK